MAKPDNGTNKPDAAVTGAVGITAKAAEAQIEAFAERLGRLVGTVQGKAEGWMDRDALRAQLTDVRDGAADLLDQLVDRVTSVTQDAKKTAVTAAATAKKAVTAAATAKKTVVAAAATAKKTAVAGAATAKKTAVAGAATATKQTRSGGFVDAPGKKHRKPMPRDARAGGAAAKRSNMRSVQASMKTVKLRGRG